MKIELRLRLAKGELSAFGLLEGAPHTQGPIPIPTYLFPMSLQETADFDWDDESSISSAGYKFLRVRISGTPEQGQQSEVADEPEWDASSIASAGYCIVDPREVPVPSRDQAPEVEQEPLEDQPPSVPDISLRRKSGPPSGGPEVIETFERMLKSGELEEGMTIKEMWRAMRPVLARNAAAFPNRRGLAYSSIARHLRSHLARKPRL
jgi:hypothetical protein